MKKIVKIEFSENSKAVLAQTKIEYEFDTTEEIKTTDNDKILEEAKDLYNKAHSYAVNKTINK